MYPSANSNVKPYQGTADSRLDSRMAGSLASQPQQNLASSIDPYYVRGDVFKRDSQYYDQLLENKRVRSINKYYDRSRSQDRYPAYGQSSGKAGVTVHDQYSVNQEEELRKYRSQHQTLLNELQKLSYGGQYGTGEQVVKKKHYTSSQSQNETIRNQETKIRNLQNTVKANNERIVKFQGAVQQLEVRMSNIQLIDRQIYKQLKSASKRDKQLLDRASNALMRAESKQEITRILEQIIAT